MRHYDCQQTYQWNYDHAPEPETIEEPPVAGRWTFCRRPVASPLGVAAGPLLNGRWCLYYALRGFDVVTYKTVRSGFRPCYPLPNLLPVKCDPLDGSQRDVSTASPFAGSWAVSFGMPSQTPETWQQDVAATRRVLPADKLLSVSVVGTMQPGWSLEQLADDYAWCAQQAVAHGADTIEINLSCPNVSTCDGQLYQQPPDAARVAQAVRRAIGDVPLIVKVGHLPQSALIERLLDAVAGSASAVATTNSVVARVRDQGAYAFDGQPRGICGQAILDASVQQTDRMTQYISRHNLPLRVVGVGGIFTAADVRRYLSAGAEAVQLATAIMIDPDVGLSIRSELSRAGSAD